MLTVCAQIETDDPRVRKLLAETVIRTAYYRPPGGTAYVRACTFGELGEHLHVDCALRSYFSGLKPQVTHRKADVLEWLEAFVGQQAQIRSAGVFVLSEGEVSPKSLFARMMLEFKAEDGVVARLTHVGLSFEDLPLTRVSWSWETADQKLIVSLEVRSSGTLDQDYLERASRVLARTSKALVEGSYDVSEADHEGS